MAVVTIDAAAIAAGGSGITGWSAKSTFAARRVLIESTPTNTFQNLGDTSTNTRAAVSFVPGSSTTIPEVWIDIRKQGSPTDNLILDICSDSSNTPGTVLGTSEVQLGSQLDASTHLPWKFTFATPVSVTSGTKYWVAIRRSGAVSATNYYQLAWSNANPTASMGTSIYNGTTWGAENTSVDAGVSIRSSLYDLYQLTQDTKIHLWKSTDNGATWTEQDAGNGPTVNSSTKPFSGDYLYDANITTGVIEKYIGVVYFSGVNTVRVRYFNLITGLWDTADIGSADATTDADFNRSVRLALTWQEQVVFFTSVADDADLNYVRRTTTTWSTPPTAVLGINSTESSIFSDVVKDKTRFLTAFYYDVLNDDFSVRTLSGTTLGTETDLDATIATSETGHASANFDLYLASGVSRVLAAYIDSNSTLQERTASLEVTSASITLGTQHQVSASTSYAGRQLATCQYGSDLYVVASTGTGIDIFVDTGSIGTWSSATNWKSGLTNCFLISAIPLTGVGILITYNDNGDVKSDVRVPPVFENAAAALSGSGTLAADTKIRAEAIAAFSGSGTITAATKATAKAAAAVSGSGTLAAVAKIRREVVVAVSGTSSLTADTKIRAEALTALDGTSTLTAATKIRREVTTTLSATGNLTAVAKVRKEVITSLSATGNLTADVSREKKAVLAVSATGTLTADTKIRAEAQAALSASGTLSADAHIYVLVATALSGSGALSAAATVIRANIHAQAALSATGSLTAAMQLEKTATVSLSAQGSLSASVRQAVGSLVKTSPNDPYSMLKTVGPAPYSMSQITVDNSYSLVKTSGSEPYTATQGETGLVGYSLVKTSPFDGLQLNIS